MEILSEKKFQLNGHTGCIYSIAAGESDETVFSAGSEGMVVKWNLKEIEHPVAVANVKGQIFSLLFIPELNHIVIGTLYGSMYVIDLKEKKEIHNISYHNQIVYDIKFLPHEKEPEILVCTKDGMLSVWNTDYKLLRTIQISAEALRQVNFNYHTQEIAIGASDSNVYILNMNDFTVKKELKAARNSVFSVCYSPDGKYLLTGSRDARLYVWDVENNYSLAEEISAHLYTVNDITYICDGKLFATASRDKTIKIWDAKTFKLKRVLDKEKYNGHHGSVNKILWNENRQLLYSVSDDHTINVWDIQPESVTVL